MAQETIDKHNNEPSSKPPPPPPPQERQEADHQDTRRHAHGEQQQQLTLRPVQPAGSHQEAAGTSGSSSGGSSGNGGAGDWLRLGLAPASPRAGDDGAGTQPSVVVFAADRAAGPPPPLLLSSQPPPRTTTAEALPPGMGFPPGPFLHQAAPGIPQASIALLVPRAGPPWLPPWSPSAVAPPPSLIPFGHRAFYTPGAGAASGLDTIRVVLPPSAVATAAGVWFALQAAPHQGREPFLPQIPRSHLRIKDGRVTVQLLIKYLAGKLGIEDESEVQITCRGRHLPAFMTLQHVRDGIWCQGDAAASPSVVPDMSAANHLMVLHYGRRP